MMVKDALSILGMTIIVVWGFLILAGISVMGWDWYRDWSARKRIRRLIKDEAADLDAEWSRVQ